MHEYVIQGSLGLAQRSTLRIEDGAGILVYVWEGEVWLTEDREREDRVLQAGQWHRLERSGAAIAVALERATVTLTAPEPANYARRIVLARADGAAPIELYNAARERRRGIVERVRGLWTGLFAPRARPTTAAL
jgi:hypothetical protein